MFRLDHGIPSIKLVKRIAANDKRSSFVGSDFSYEDVSGRAVEEDSHALLREEKFEGKDIFVGSKDFTQFGQLDKNDNLYVRLRAGL